MRDRLINDLDSADCFLRNRATSSSAPLNEYDIEVMLDIAKICDEAARTLEKAIVPPCKVGGKVYIISRNKVKECEVVFVGLSADEKRSHFNFVENYADGTFCKSYSMVFEVIGKSVFLTREEAEKALKGNKLFGNTEQLRGGAEE